MSQKNQRSLEMKDFYYKYIKNAFCICVIIAIAITLVNEICGRRSIRAGIVFAVKEPLVFLLNAFIIFISLSIVFLVRRRIFVCVLVSAIWLGIGITNGVMLGYRNTPFTFIDVQLAKSGLAVMENYMPIWQIVGIVAGVVVLIILLVCLYIFAPKYKGNLSIKWNGIGVLMIIGVFYICIQAGLDTKLISANFGNLNLSYKEYGVSYCFGITLLDTGIEKPIDYASHLKKLKKNIDKVETKVPEKKPNIIFLQLESFFDLTNVKELEFSKDPIPNFRKLKETYSSGYLKMPSYGAGTANTEFEILTGMNLNYFGAGEYPYKSILQKTTCESLSTELKELGYKAHAIHNNGGTFYDRNFIFSQMGFDTFISLEMMGSREKTPNGWEKDAILTDQVMDALESSKGEDFIYTISVQGHGEYPEEPYTENPAITLSGLQDEKRQYKLEYYANQIYEMDLFIADLIESLEAYGEDTVLVMYGDHLPSIDFKSKELENGSIYETEYIVWNNMNLPKEDKTIEAYQLSATVLDKLGINNGILTKYHQTYSKSKSYRKYLKMLQYDMLYGKQYVYNNRNPFTATKLQFGVKPVETTGITSTEDGTMLTGMNFNKYSHVELNGKEQNTTFVDENTLTIKENELKVGDVIVIQQRSKRGVILYESGEFVVG